MSIVRKIPRKLEFYISTQPAADGNGTEVNSIDIAIPVGFLKRVRQAFPQQNNSPINFEDQTDVHFLRNLFIEVSSHPKVLDEKLRNLHDNDKVNFNFNDLQHHPRRVFYLLKLLKEYGKDQRPSIFFSEIEHLFKQYQIQLQAKSRSSMAKDRSKFIPTGRRPEQSNNPTYFAKKESKKVDKEPTEYVVKGREGGKGSVAAEWEAVLSERYRMLGGPDRHPKTRPLYNQHGEITGVAVKVISFINLNDAFKLQGKFKIDQLLKSGVGFMGARLLLYQESDGHVENLGFDAEGNLIKIDNGRSAHQEKTYTYIPNGIPGTDFDMTEEKIRSFPILPEPFSIYEMRWIFSKYHEEKYFDFKCIELQQHREFQRQVYYTFLKELLIPDTTDHALANGVMGSEARKNEAYQFFKSIKDKLKSTFVNMPEFKEFLLIKADIPSLLHDLEKEFKAYSDSVTKDHPEFKIDFEQVKKEFFKYYTTAANEKLNDIQKKLSDNQKVYPWNQLRDSCEEIRKIKEMCAIYAKDTTEIDPALLNSMESQAQSRLLMSIDSLLQSGKSVNFEMLYKTVNSIKQSQEEHGKEQSAIDQLNKVRDKLHLKLMQKFDVTGTQENTNQHNYLQTLIRDTTDIAGIDELLESANSLFQINQGKNFQDKNSIKTLIDLATKHSQHQNTTSDSPEEMRKRNETIVDLTLLRNVAVKQLNSKIKDYNALIETNVIKIREMLLSAQIDLCQFDLQSNKKEEFLKEFLIQVNQNTQPSAVISEKWFAMIQLFHDAKEQLSSRYENPKEIEECTNIPELKQGLDFIQLNWKKLKLAEKMAARSQAQPQPILQQPQPRRELSDSHQGLFQEQKPSDQKEQEKNKKLNPFE